MSREAVQQSLTGQEQSALLATSCFCSISLINIYRNPVQFFELWNPFQDLQAEHNPMWGSAGMLEMT